MAIVIFTDLDGTLLNEKYSFSEAKPALKLIKRKKIPLVICTSKTRAEIEKYRKLLKNKEPFISENGGAIFIPKRYFDFKFRYDREDKNYYIVEFGTSYSKLKDFIERLRKKVTLISFDELSAKEISRDSGLTLKMAKLAKKREYDIPIKIIARDEKYKKKLITEIRSEAKKAGLSFIEGTKYSHITGKNDKGKAVKFLLRLYKKKYKNEKLKSIAIGDSENDFDMLKAVDKGFLVKKPDMTYASGKYKKALGIGPKGWKEIVLKELKKV